MMRKCLPIGAVALSLLLTGCAHSPKDIVRTVPVASEKIPASEIRPAIETVAGREYGQASLWNNSPNSLFGDRRASGPGDILTVEIDIDERAEMRNSIQANRQAGQSFGLGNFFGLTDLLSDILPSGADLENAVEIDRATNVNGIGQLQRRERLTLTLAANVLSVTPNGDLRIAGLQDIQVNSETRTLAVTGVVRREDITRRNIITLDKIANAQVSYGGRGQVTRAVRDSVGQKVLDRVIPF